MSSSQPIIFVCVPKQTHRVKMFSRSSPCLPQNEVSSLRKTREGWNCRFQKTPRPKGGDKVLCSIDPRFPAGLPLLVPEILEFVAFRDSGKLFQQFCRDFPSPRTHPTNCHSLLEFSDSLFRNTALEIVFRPFKIPRQRNGSTVGFSGFGALWAVGAVAIQGAEARQ